MCHQLRECLVLCHCLLHLSISFPTRVARGDEPLSGPRAGVESGARCEANLNAKVDGQIAGAVQLREDILGDFAELFAVDGSPEDHHELDFFEVQFMMILRRTVDGEELGKVAKNVLPQLDRPGDLPVHLGVEVSFAARSRFHSGAWAGEWLITTRYSSWEAYGKVQEAVAKDEAFAKLMTHTATFAELKGRNIAVGVDLSQRPKKQPQPREQGWGHLSRRPPPAR